MTKKAVIFDFDGTLVQTLPQVLSILNKIGRTYSQSFIKITVKDIEKYREKSAAELFNDFKIPRLKLLLMVRKIKKELAKNMAKIKPVDGIYNLLLQLKKSGCTIGIVSSNSRENVLGFLLKNKIDVFDFVATESNLFGKERALARVIRKYKLDKKSTVYVGDEIRDITACRKVGLPIISVSWGFNNKKGLLKNSPDFLAERVGEIEKILEKT